MRRRKGWSAAARDAHYQRLISGASEPSRRATVEVYGRKGSLTAYEHEQLRKRGAAS